ncbi:hypothetical protein K8I31_20275 [bacterium]|nr:hypothetical protein [bacterium]
MIKQKRVIEFTVASIIVVLLFVVMFPNFQKAQHSAGAAKSLHDLSEIAKAMEVFNQEASDKSTVIQSLSIKDLGKDSEPGVWAYLLYEFNHLNMEFPSSYFSRPPSAQTKNAKKILSQLEFDYRPPKSMLLLNGHEFRNNYVVETGVWRRYAIRSGYQPNQYYVGVKRIETFPFDVKGAVPYIGAARGPYFDAHIGEIQIPKPETPYAGSSRHPSTRSSRVVDDSHFVEYSPTNGVRSHGYVVYRSPAGPVADVTEYRHAQWRNSPLLRGAAQKIINSAS